MLHFLYFQTLLDVVCATPAGKNILNQHKLVFWS